MIIAFYDGYFAGFMTSLVEVPLTFRDLNGTLVSFLAIGVLVFGGVGAHRGALSCDVIVTA
jgi:hypothetical protein